MKGVPCFLCTLLARLPQESLSGVTASRANRRALGHFWCARFLFRSQPRGTSTEPSSGEEPSWLVYPRKDLIDYLCTWLDRRHCSILVKESPIDQEAALIERLKAQIQSGKTPTEAYSWHRPRANPPVTQPELEQAESMLGFALPPLLKRIYLEVGNGGFGPGYGLFRLSDERQTDHFDVLVQNYLSLRSLTQEEIDEAFAGEEDRPILWPEKILMLCDWGCTIYSSVDCASSPYPILVTDANVSLSEINIESPSLAQWLEDWLDGTLVFPG